MCCALRVFLALAILVSQPLYADEEWYQEGKSSEDVRKDLAWCKAQALLGAVSGGNYRQRGAETARLLSFVRLCMEAKGYSYGEPPPPVVPTAVPPVPPTPTPSKIKPGFRDLKWGDGVPAGMELIADGDTKRYVRKGESMGIGPVRAKAITYGFREDRFFLVEALFAPSDEPALRFFLEQTWGPSLPNRDHTVIASWYAPNSGKDDTVCALRRGAAEGDLLTLLIANRTTIDRLRKPPDDGL